MTESKPRVLVLLAEGAEEMETAITVDVLRRADLEVVLAGIDGAAAVTCSRGLRIVPDCGLADAEGDFAMVVLPGGAGGAERLGASPEVGAVLVRQHAAGRPIAAICAGPVALVRHGIAAGRKMTSHPSVRDTVAAHGVYSEERVVEDDGLLTSRGPGTAFEFALAIVTRLLGEDVARELAPPMLLPRLPATGGPARSSE